MSSLLNPKMEAVEEPRNLQPEPLSRISRNTQNTPPSSSSFPSPEDNVYSEFNRIAQLFRSSFAERLKRYDDVSVLDSESGAVVPVPDEHAIPLAHAPATRRPKCPRSSELVRVTNLGFEDGSHFRSVVKRARMLYDSLRIYFILEEEKRKGIGFGKRSRPDLRAASVMRDQGLWLNRDKRIVGSIPGVQIGDLFFSRMELCVVGLHGQIQAGIDYLPASQSANGEPVATSIIVSGGYEDDDDRGDLLVYTGHGGQGQFGKHCEHQKLEGGNLALERSMCYGIEVRVIRGFRYDNDVSQKVYVYDGLFKILDCWFDVGKSGFGVFKYKLMRIQGQPEMGSSVMKLAKMLRTRPLSARPRGYLSLDISNKKEKVPIFLYNDIDKDHEPLLYEYLVTAVFPPFVSHQAGPLFACDCISGCNDACVCVMKNGGELAYDFNGNLLRGNSVIFECGPSCQCPPSCRNRVTQKGLRHRLEVFRSRETGWGVRSLDIIHAGSFICEYTGVALTKEQAEVLSMNGDSLVFPGRFLEKWREWGDVSQFFSDPVGFSHPSIPPLDFAMEVSRMRNVACYISHSMDPNVVVQFVLYDHNNLMFPHVMVFAIENIPPLTELSLDYGVVNEWTETLAICN